jgi:hypothetical protein
MFEHVRVYGLTNRPAGYAQVPRGWERVEERTPQFRHGTVRYDHALPLNELYSFEMTPVYRDEAEACEALLVAVAEQKQRTLEQVKAKLRDLIALYDAEADPSLPPSYPLHTLATGFQSATQVWPLGQYTAAELLPTMRQLLRPAPAPTAALAPFRLTFDDAPRRASRRAKRNGPHHAKRNGAHGARCSCGATGDHVVAERESADGKYLVLWSSGELTQRGGVGFPGVPVARSRDAAQVRVALEAGRLVLGEASLWDAAEIPALYAAARRVAARGGSPGDLRAAMDARDVPRIPIRWEVLSTDNRGDMTSRVGHLPRLMWPGVSIWHERGIYEVMYRKAVNGRDAWHGTGITFRSQRDLLRFLAENRPGTSLRPAVKTNSAMAERSRDWQTFETVTDEDGDTRERGRWHTEITPARLTRGHAHEPETVDATRTASRVVAQSYRLANGESAWPRQLGAGNFGIAYRLETDDGPRVVKLAAATNVHGRPWTREEQTRNLLHEAGVANELSRLGFRCMPRTVFVRFAGGTPALVREYGEPAGALTGPEYGALEAELVAIEREHGWGVHDELSLYRRADGSVFVGDVGFWQAPRPLLAGEKRRPWKDFDSSLNGLLERAQRDHGMVPGVVPVPRLWTLASFLLDTSTNPRPRTELRDEMDVDLSQEFLDAVRERLDRGVPTPPSLSPWVAAAESVIRGYVPATTTTGLGAKRRAARLAKAIRG